MDARTALYKNVILAGGTMCFQVAARGSRHLCAPLHIPSAVLRTQQRGRGRERAPAARGRPPQGMPGRIRSELQALLDAPPTSPWDIDSAAAGGSSAGADTPEP